MSALSDINTRKPKYKVTPQTAPAKKRQVPNSAGGFVFKTDDRNRFRRFLILGIEGGTYYVGEKKLALDNAKVVQAVAAKDGLWAVEQILEVSENGRAVKQEATLFALAVVCTLGDDEARRAAFLAIPRVCRTATMLFSFIGFVGQFRGWGQGLKKALGRWYSTKTADALAFQMVKYRQREGFTHRDALRLGHPKVEDEALKALFEWATWKAGQDKIEPNWLESPFLPRSVKGYLLANQPGADLLELIKEYRLTWEMLPTEALKSVDVWRAFLDNGMPMTAMQRNLGRMTSIGVFDNKAYVGIVVKAFTDQEIVRKSRLHPLSLLVALKTYASGQGIRGSLTWVPNQKIVAALDKAFYLAFGNVEKTGKRFLLALDVSGSMAASIAGVPLSAREASAAMALVTEAVEDDVTIVGFTSGSRTTDWRRQAALTELNISSSRRLDDNIREISGLPFGGTDCALPVVGALNKNEKYDAIIVFTDSETYFGDTHPHQALKMYRDKVSKNCRFIVVGTTSTGFSIADDRDPLSLDIAGFDTATPQVITDFIQGRI